MEGRDKLLADVMACTSDLLEECLRAMDARTRGQFLHIKSQLSDAVASELGENYSFHDECPYSVVGIFYGEVWCLGYQMPG